MKLKVRVLTFEIDFTFGANTNKSAKHSKHAVWKVPVVKNVFIPLPNIGVKFVKSTDGDNEKNNATNEIMIIGAIKAATLKTPFNPIKLLINIVIVKRIAICSCGDS